MIIEAAPRLRDGTLGTFSPSSIKHLGKTQFSDGPRENKTYDRLAHFSQHCEKKILYDREKTRANLLDCERTTHQAQNRRTSHRGHPYNREGKTTQSAKKLDIILSKLSYHKYPAWLRPLHREKAIEIIQKLSPNLKYKLEKRESKLKLLPPPIFTANANENNDNCPGTTHSPGRFAVTNQLTSSPVADVEICDVEIHDLTEAGIRTRQDTNLWNKSRRSFNTNPLSASSFRSDKHPRLMCLDDLFSEDSLPRNDCGQSPIFYPEPERRFSNLAESQSRFSDHYSSVKSTEESESPSPSIEKLVEFFESNSSPALSRIEPKNQNSQTSQVSSRSSQHIQRTPNAFLNSYQRGNPFINQELKRPSSGSRRSANTQEHRDIPADFFHFFPEVWNSVIKISSGHIPHSEISITGGIYNNNGNAASATSESSLVWPGNKYQKFPPIGKIDNLHPRISPSPSPTVFSKGCERSSSTSGRYSPDIDGEDFQSTRVLTWLGTRPVTAPVDSRKQRDRLHLDNLIDLQTTSTRSRNWRSTKGHNLLADNAHIKSTYKQSLGKGEQGGERIQNSQHQVERKKSEAVCLSANNHHNAPWFSSEERSYKERIHEKHFPFEHLQFHRSLLDPFNEKRSFFSNSDPDEMGCIQSIAKAKVSPDRCHHSVIVEDIQAAIDRTPTEIEEKSPIVLRYRTPYFRASAHVIVPPIPRKETWTVGWIQACDSMKFINQYGTLGSSSWEIPALKNRRITAVSDSDGVSYPWYGNTTEIATVEGPTETSRSLTLRMNDNFYPSVTWDIPVSEGSEAHLTHIVRDQSFTTWLAAVNQTTGRLEVLRTVKWHFYLEIEVDPKQELGKRAMIVSPLVQKQPIILKNHSEPIYISSPNRGSNNGSANRQKRLHRRPGAGGDNNSNNHTNFIPKSALVRPSANNAQTLIWRPTRDVPVVVVPAKEEYKENNEVVWFTRTPTMHGHDHNVRVLSLQEMSQLKQTIS